MLGRWYVIFSHTIPVYSTLNNYRFTHHCIRANRAYVPYSIVPG